MPKQLFTKKYGSSRQQAAAAAVARARATILNSRRGPIAPPRTGGFWGPQRRAGELKAVDTAPGNYACSSTPNISLINGVATGTDYTERIGRKIMLKSLFIRGYMLPADNTSGPSLSRLLVVYDSQTNGTAPTITDILKTSDVRAQLNLDNRDRFKIIFDKQYVVAVVDNTATQAIASGPTVHNVKLYKRLNHEVQFSGTTAAVGSIATGSVYLVLLNDNVASLGTIFALSTRIRFTDV